MTILTSILQIIVALGLLNVWLLRFHRETAYRGGSARNMQEEFAAYGLPGWSIYVIGFLKIAAALCLLIGLWVHPIVFPAAALICVLMIGALAMHIKVRDPLRKALPALLVFLMSFIICIAAYW